ncbi:hypothetical protein [Methylobacterium terrae]|nr:hypothetical protein [Methylobacterium terrae]
MARKLSAARCEIGRLNGQIRDMRGAHTRRCQEMAERLRAESARADRAEEAARRLADAAAATTLTTTAPVVLHGEITRAISAREAWDEAVRHHVQNGQSPALSRLT